MIDKRFIVGEIKELGELYQTLIIQQKDCAHYLVEHMMQEDSHYQEIFSQLQSHLPVISSYYGFLTELHNHLDDLYTQNDLKLESLVELKRIMIMATGLKQDFQATITRTRSTCTKVKNNNTDNTLVAVDKG